MNLRASDVFVGIDQTGAVDRLGQPKPLMTCVLSGDRAQMTLMSVPRFHPSEIRRRLTLKPKQRLFIFVDSVFGMPESLVDRSFLIRGLIAQAGVEPAYGARAAEAFFQQWFNEKGASPPRRRVEEICAANSLFKRYPAQKNIQTGTFRMLKDLSMDDPKSYAIYPFDDVKNHLTIIFEGYPSLYWRTLFQFKHRTPSEIFSVLKRERVKCDKIAHAVLAKDANACDSVILALAARRLLKNFKQVGLPEPTRRSSKIQKEGWIFGADASAFR